MGIMQPKTSNSQFICISVNTDLSYLATRSGKLFLLFPGSLQYPIIESEEIKMTEVFTKLKHLRFMNSYISSVKKSLHY